MNKVCECCGRTTDRIFCPEVVFNTGQYGNMCFDCIYAPEPKIVCLVGSTRFFEQFAQANLEQTLKGNIVLSIGCDTHHVDAQYTEQQKQELDRLHKRKINKADIVLCLNIGGYIGSSTASELSWAKKQGKPIIYLEPVSEC